MLPLIFAIFASLGRLAGSYEGDRHSHPFMLRLAFGFIYFIKSLGGPFKGFITKKSESCPSILKFDKKDDSEKGNYFCGGALITGSFGISTASCMSKYVASTILKSRAGANFITKAGENEQM